MQDQEIIELYWRRDESAIQETADKYGPYCRRIAMNVLNNPEDAEECLSDTYLRTWNAIPDARPKHFRGFLAKIVRRVAIDKWKHNSAAKRGNGAVALALDELEECISGLSDVESEYEEKEFYKSIDNFIKQLPDEEQRIFVWRYFYLESVKDIAKSLHKRSNHVSVILSRTRRKLKHYLEEEGYGL